MSKGPEAFRTISEVAEELDLPQHVLRFWETRFSQIRPMKRGGGRRYYRPDDVDLLRGIRHLLYGEGYTIKGVQRILKEQGPRIVIGVGQGEVMPSLGAVPPDERDFGSGEREGWTSPPEHQTELSDDLDMPVPDSELEAAPPPEPMPPRRILDRLRGEPAAGLSRDEVQRLQATLVELLECKRLLDQTR